MQPVREESTSLRFNYDLRKEQAELLEPFAAVQDALDAIRNSAEFQKVLAALTSNGVGFSVQVKLTGERTLYINLNLCAVNY